jgi:hypothetical protein
MAPELAARVPAGVGWHVRELRSRDDKVFFIIFWIMGARFTRDAQNFGRDSSLMNAAEPS